MSFTVISMFSGAGGLDMGFHNKGFKILWANDFSNDACDTYDKWANFNSDGSRKSPENCTIIECGDVSKLDLENVLPDVSADVVLGGFPCQGFSLAGPRQVDDSRNVLYRHFVEMVRIKKPKVIVAENVIGIKTLGNGAVFDKIIEDFSELGYTMSAPTVNAKNYGVPQDRMRVIFIGIKNEICHGGAYIFPSGDPKIVTLKDALKDLPPVDMSDVCQAAFSSRYMSRNRQRNFDEVSFTIPAMAKQVPLSPDSDGMEFEDVDKFRFIGKYRRLSYKEAAAIQTFPPEIEFCGDLDSKYRQIGNAVPVKLAESIAHEVKKILTSDDLTPFLNIENPEAEIYGPTADKRLTNTVLSGKAFEYATLIEIYRELTLNGWDTDSLKIIKDKNYKNVENAYQIIRGSDEDLDDNAQLETIRLETMTNDYNRAARVAAVYLRNVEPILSSSENLYGFLRVIPDFEKSIANCYIFKNYQMQHNDYSKENYSNLVARNSKKLFNILEKIVDERNNVAHGWVENRISFSDIDNEYIEYIHYLSKSILEILILSLFNTKYNHGKLYFIGKPIEVYDHHIIGINNKGSLLKKNDYLYAIKDKAKKILRIESLQKDLKDIDEISEYNVDIGIGFTKHCDLNIDKNYEFYCDTIPFH